MKNTLILICLFGFFTPICLAGQNNMLRAGNRSLGAAHKSAQVYEMRGKVDSVILEDLVNEIQPKIIVTASDGKKHTFVVRPITTIYDATWKPVTLDKIMIGQFVRIKYRANKNGYTVALSIKPSREQQS